MSEIIFLPANADGIDNYDATSPREPNDQEGWLEMQSFSDDEFNEEWQQGETDEFRQAEPFTEIDADTDADSAEDQNGDESSEELPGVLWTSTMDTADFMSISPQLPTTDYDRANEKSGIEMEQHDNNLFLTGVAMETENKGQKWTSRDAKKNKKKKQFKFPQLFNRKKRPLKANSKKQIEVKKSASIDAAAPGATKKGTRQEPLDTTREEVNNDSPVDKANNHIFNYVGAEIEMGETLATKTDKSKTSTPLEEIREQQPEDDTRDEDDGIVENTDRSGGDAPRAQMEESSDDMYPFSHRAFASVFGMDLLLDSCLQTCNNMSSGVGAAVKARVSDESRQ